MNYSDITGFAETWGLVYLVILFLCTLAYAFWPGNKEKFARGARLPLEDDAPWDYVECWDTYLTQL